MSNTRHLAAVAEKPVEPISNEPEIVHQGRYRLYKKPDGTMRVQYRRDDKDEDDFFEVDGALVALAQAAGEGKLSPQEMVKKVLAVMMSRHH